MKTIYLLNETCVSGGLTTSLTTAYATEELAKAAFDDIIKCVKYTDGDYYTNGTLLEGYSAEEEADFFEAWETGYYVGHHLIVSIEATELID